MGGFVFKSERVTGNGCAAGCEAVAAPRRSPALIDLGYAPGAAFGL